MRRKAAQAARAAFLRIDFKSIDFISIGNSLNRARKAQQFEDFKKEAYDRRQRVGKKKRSHFPLGAKVTIIIIFVRHFCFSFLWAFA